MSIKTKFLFQKRSRIINFLITKEVINIKYIKSFTLTKNKGVDTSRILLNLCLNKKSNFLRMNDLKTLSNLSFLPHILKYRIKKQ